MKTSEEKELAELYAEFSKEEAADFRAQSAALFCPLFV